MILENSLEAKASPFLERIENVLDDLSSLKGKYMADAKVLRTGIKDIYTDAKENDVPVKALKGLVKYRELERKQSAIGHDLEEDDLTDYETLVKALGVFAETPLGQAALDLAEELAPKRRRKPRSPAAEHAKALGGESDEERAALEEMEEAGGIGGVASSFAVQE